MAVLFEYCEVKKIAGRFCCAVNYIKLILILRYLSLLNANRITLRNLIRKGDVKYAVHFIIYVNKVKVFSRIFFIRSNWVFFFDGD